MLTVLYGYIDFSKGAEMVKKCKTNSPHSPVKSDDCPKYDLSNMIRMVRSLKGQFLIQCKLISDLLMLALCFGKSVTFFVVFTDINLTNYA